MALRPNWFDREFGDRLATAKGKEALREIANDPRIIQAVDDAVTALEENIERAKKEGHVWASATRIQTIRKAIVDVLEAAD